MVDSPRFNPSLAEALEKKGGVSSMVLSHIDDVGDHERFVSFLCTVGTKIILAVPVPA